MHDLEPDRDRVLTRFDAAMAGYDLTELLTDAAWTVEPKTVPAELETGYPAVLHTADGDPIHAAAFTALRVITESALDAAHRIVGRVDADEV